MSSTTSIIFYCPDPIANPELLAAPICKVIGFDAIRALTVHPRKRSEPSSDYSGVPIGDCQKYYRKNVVMLLDCGCSRATKAFAKTIRDSLGTEIAGEVFLGDFAVRVGKHVIAGLDSDFRRSKVADSVLSVVIWGYGTPNDFDKFAKKLASAPPVKNLLKEFQRSSKLKFKIVVDCDC